MRVSQMFLGSRVVSSAHLAILELSFFEFFHFQHRLAVVAVVVLVVVVLAHRLSKLFSGTWVGGFPPFNVLSAIRLSMCWRPPASQYCRLAAFHSVVGLPSFGVGGFPPLFGMRRCHLAFSASIKAAVKNSIDVLYLHTRHTANTYIGCMGCVCVFCLQKPQVDNLHESCTKKQLTRKQSK